VATADEPAPLPADFSTSSPGAIIKGYVNRKGESIYHLPGGRWPGAKLQRDTLAKIVRTELGNYEMHHPPADEAVAFVECMYTIDATFPKALAIAFRSHSI